MSDAATVNAGTITIHVSSAAELMIALANAKGGETILLSAGHYGELNLKATVDTFARFASEVTIKSADAADPAIFSKVTLNGVSNLSIDGVKLDYEAAPGEAPWAKPFSITNSDHIAIRNSDFDGDLAEGVGPDSDGYGTGYGLFVTGSSYITVENNEFSNWRNGGVFTNSQHLTVSGNDIHDISGDGLDFVSVSQVLIEGNYIHDFARAPSSTVHADMIQFWTSGEVTNADVTIRGNFLDSGDGLWTQSIFMRNGAAEGASTTEMYYRNILIEDNLIHNAHAHGITVGETVGLIVRNNTLLHNKDSADGSSVYIPGIYMRDASLNVVIANNILPQKWGAVPAGTENREVENNLVVQYDDPNGSNYVGKLFVNALAGSLATLDDLQPVPGGLIEQLGVGSSVRVFNSDGTTDPVDDGTTVPVDDGTTVPVDDGTTVPDDEGTTAPNYMELEATIVGSSRNDKLIGTVNDDVIDGGAGNDTIKGKGGNDVLRGGKGDDCLIGGDGNDVLIGGPGSNKLVGGAGADVFVFIDLTSRDRIVDFSRKEGDRIDLSAIDANVKTANNDSFVFIDKAPFSGTPGELRYELTRQGHAVVTGDVDGDGKAEFSFVVANTSVLKVDDFADF